MLQRPTSSPRREPRCMLNRLHYSYIGFRELEMVAGGRIRSWPRLVYSEHAVPRVMPRGRAASADFTIDISIPTYPHFADIGIMRAI